MRAWRCMPIALALAGAGCIEAGKLDTAIETRDRLAAEVREGSYTVPPEVPPTEVRIDPFEVTIGEALRGDRLERVGVRLELEYVHESGSATGQVAIYAAGGREETYAGAPILAAEVVLEPGRTLQVERAVEADPRLLELVRAGHLYLGLGFRWAPTGGVAVSGRYRITSLRVLVTSHVGGVTASLQERLPSLR